MVGPWYALDARTRNDKDTKNGTTDGRALPDHVTKFQMSCGMDVEPARLGGKVNLRKPSTGMWQALHEWKIRIAGESRLERCIMPAYAKVVLI